jgi:sulfur-oxidizing protein SoxY
MRMIDAEKPQLLRLDRRHVLTGSIAAAAAAVLPSLAHAAYEDDGDPASALKHIANGRPIKPGRVKLTLPELAENGNVVTLAVTVDSPMTTADHVKTIHIVAEKNPLANLARFHLSPRSGHADVQTNVRLATTQTVNAIAEMSDGTLWSGAATVLVTLSACLDGG